MRKLILFSSIFLAISSSSAKASENFHTRYDVTYSYNDQGRSTVTQEIFLTNKFSQVYASQYQLRLTGENHGKIVGHDSSGPLTIQSQPKNGNTEILVNFNDQIVGVGNTLHFTLSYAGPSAIRKGQVWEIILPKLGNADSIDEYSLHLRVPYSFGKAAYITPSPKSQTGGNYSFTKDQLGHSAIVAAFGDFQTYSFTLLYNVNNPHLKLAKATIALPPDTAYQRIIYDSISPPPLNTTSDQDGNWLASYLLNSGQNITITAIGQARVIAQNSYPTLPQTSKYLQSLIVPTKFWPSDSPHLSSAALANQTPQSIYDYVVRTLDYDYSRINAEYVRRGGVDALNSPSTSLCSEFTDSFITLARAAKIPSREINGFAYTIDSKLRPTGLDSNILHAWPEYWDESQNQWVAVDPTWGQTTGGIDYFHRFDLSHLTFVIHGQSDSFPHPPTNSKVQLAPYKEIKSPLPQATWNQPFQILPFLPTRSSLTIKNPSGQAIYNLAVDIDHSNLPIISPIHTIIPILPPYSNTNIPLVFAPHNIPSFSIFSFRVTLADFPISYNIPNKLFIGWQLTLGLTIAIILVALGFIAHRSWSLHFQGRRRENSLRR